jgi:hypothetical protein
MRKIALAPLVLALAMASACTRSTDTAISSAGTDEHPGQSVELVEGGFSYGSKGLHHADMIKFGEPRAEVIAALSGALGRPTATGRNAECPSGPVDWVSFGSLDLHFEGGRFVGWVIDEAGEPKLESYHGLTFGDRRSDVDGGDMDVEVVADSSLGTELIVNGIGVLMSGPGQSDTVTNLFSGTTCFAR